MWEIIPKITTGIAFAAFLVAGIIQVLRISIKRKEKILDKVPEKDRLKALQDMAENLGISASLIKDEEKLYKLVHEQINLKAKQKQATYGKKGTDLFFSIYLRMEVHIYPAQYC